MKWLEVIRVQAASSQEGAMEKRLFDLRGEVLKGPECSGLITFEVYRQAALPGFFAIHLPWDSEIPELPGSVLGWNLTETLKAFGLVNHSVWLAASPEELHFSVPGIEEA